ncbi:MAG: hypothetical protein AAFY26_21055 [Cyanobacteria bacterium J06638_22]
MRFTIEIPEGIPFPKFELFQKVRYGKEIVHVVGMTWICPLDGIKQEMYGYGWMYRVSTLLGEPPEAYFTVAEVKSYEIDEEELFPFCEGEALSDKAEASCLGKKQGGN